MSRINRFIKLAMKTAKNKASNKNKCSLHGAVLVKGHRVINIGWNTNKFSASASKRYMTQAFYISTHAECAVLYNIDDRICRGSTIYVARVNKGDKSTSRLSKPCSNCENKMRSLGLKECYYTTNDPNKIGRIIF